MPCAEEPSHEREPKSDMGVGRDFCADVAVCCRWREFGNSGDASCRRRREALGDRQAIADVFAISQLSPGPNVLIVTLIGYSVAGVAGALAATLAMCVPTAVLAFGVSRLLTRSTRSHWPATVQAALVPLSIGLMGASGLILALTSDR